MDWQHLLASITGMVAQALLRRHAYLGTANRILRHPITGRGRLTEGERTTLAEMGQHLGQEVHKDVATIGTPDTMLGWHRTRVAQTGDGSQQPKTPGHPTIDPALEALVVHMAQEHRSWGNDWIGGALAQLLVAVQGMLTTGAGHGRERDALVDICHRHQRPGLATVPRLPLGRRPRG